MKVMQTSGGLCSYWWGKNQTTILCKNMHQMMHEAQPTGGWTFHWTDKAGSELEIIRNASRKEFFVVRRSNVGGWLGCGRYGVPLG